MGWSKSIFRTGITLQSLCHNSDTSGPTGSKRGSGEGIKDAH